jgi:hypothetical protein
MQNKTSLILTLYKTLKLTTTKLAPGKEGLEPTPYICKLLFFGRLFLSSSRVSRKAHHTTLLRRQNFKLGEGVLGYSIPHNTKQCIGQNLWAVRLLETNSKDANSWIWSLFSCWFGTMSQKGCDIQFFAGCCG